MDTTPARPAFEIGPSPLGDEPILGVYEAKRRGELQTGVWISGCMAVFFTLGTLVLACLRQGIGAGILTVFVGIAWYGFWMSRRMQESNARLSFNSRQFIAEKDDGHVLYDLRQLRVINEILAQDSDSKSCTYRVEFKDGTTYWVSGEDDAKAFVTELRRVSGVRII